MEIALVVAASKNNVIGNRGDIPWKLPADLKHFKRVTMGTPIIMGRKTFESIGGSLPGRTNIVVTRQKDFSAEGCRVVHSMEKALEFARELQDAERVCVIGGGDIYRQAMPYADTIHLTRIHEEFAGDAYFPEVDMTQWEEASREEGVVNDENSHPHTFITYKRKS